MDEGLEVGGGEGREPTLLALEEEAEHLAVGAERFPASLRERQVIFEAAIAPLQRRERFELALSEKAVATMRPAAP